jgi:hypothetical protein
LDLSPIKNIACCGYGFNDFLRRRHFDKTGEVILTDAQQITATAFAKPGQFKYHNSQLS